MSSEIASQITWLCNTILHIRDTLGEHRARIAALEQSHRNAPGQTPSTISSQTSPTFQTAERIASLTGTFWAAATALWQAILWIIPRAAAIGGLAEAGWHTIKPLIGL